MCKSSHGLLNSGFYSNIPIGCPTGTLKLPSLDRVAELTVTFLCLVPPLLLEIGSSVLPILSDCFLWNPSHSRPPSHHHNSLGLACVMATTQQFSLDSSSVPLRLQEGSFRSGNIVAAQHPCI